MAFLNKFTNIIAAVVGTIQLVLPILKEAIADVTRVCGFVFFWTDVDEKFLVWVNKYYDIAYKAFEDVKNFLIKYGIKV